jgi:hypothetical protein
MKLSEQEREQLCGCGHPRKTHCGPEHEQDCGAPNGNGFCNCKKFQEENVMKKKKAVKAKSEGRQPALAPYVNGPMKIYATYKGKEYEAQVLSSGVIKFQEQEFASPSSAARAILKGETQRDGWHFWSFNKDGKRFQLAALRPVGDIVKRERSEKKASKPKPERKAPKRKRSPKAPSVADGVPATEPEEASGEPREAENNAPLTSDEVPF